MLQTFQTLQHSLGMPNPAANRHPKATSMASYGRPSLRLPALKRLKPLKSLKPLKLCKRVSERPTAQAKAIPRPYERLLLDGPACRSPGVTRFKPFKRFNTFLACLIPQPTGTPRPHQWLLMGVQACRLPALKRLKPLKPLKPFKPLKLCKRVSEQPTAQAKAIPRPHIHRSFWAVQPAVRQALHASNPSNALTHLGMPNPAANRHPKATSMASYGRPSPPFASP